jgi:methionyl-tRNA formyltransferase
VRVVFMGTPPFAVPSLDALLRDHEVAAVYTRPDAAAGRGRRTVFSPVKQRALEAGVPVEQPATLRPPDVAERLTRLAPDVVVVAAYGLVLPPAVLEVPAQGCLNVHASLLPRWRGAAPVQRAILAGDDVTGVSIMRMEEGLDTGPYALQVTVSVGEKTSDQLTAELAATGARALSTYLASARGTYPWTVQDESRVTYAGKVTAADVVLDPSLTRADALRRVRASSRSAPARATVAGRGLVALRVSDAHADLAPGAAACERDLVLGLADGAIRVDELVPEGRRPMSGADWIRGAHLDADCTWGAP